MPTQHVSPAADDLLQGVANALLKARKVVVVTGAGISTNSGIPDFRSENGLYSLIQAQFDAASRQDIQVPLQDDESDEEDGPPAKRRRISRESSVALGDAAPETHDEIKREIQDDVHEQIHVRIGPRPATPEPRDETEPHDTIVVQSESRVVELEQDSIIVHHSTDTAYITPRPKRSLYAAQPPTSPLSSPPAEDCIVLPSTFRTRNRRLVDVAHPASSSPLSSPPPILFDPFRASPSDASSDRRSSTSPSEVDEAPSSQNLFSSSQTSNRNSLPNMKGKDLFDASIWSDPLRTSVFYTFATSLRQKIRDVKPTTSHHFISHLRDRGKLVRCYTQNIDQIEEKVGLSTSLTDGPGSRGRFSRRSTANTAQLTKMVEQVCGDADASEKPQPDPDSSQQSQSQSEGTTPAEGDAEQAKTAPKPQRSGVECVFLHGSLDLLRCFLCGRVCPWDELELETMSGQQPECPHCVGATVAREEKGKRALGVGKLRPDIVLYGEEHPNAHLISPIVTHDLTLYPDMLLILGTSLRVHGLKVMVREFAKAVHSKGGKVVFVNFTKPPESSWGDIIDYWVEWDCDAWVQDLQGRIPKLWQAPEPPKPKKKRELSGTSEDSDKPEVKRPPPANPAAIRDTKVTGAYWSLKIVGDLHRITGTPPLRRASISAAPKAIEATTAVKKKPKRPRKSAPGALEQAKKPSTLNPNHGRSRKQAAPKSQSPAHPRDAQNAISSILNSVKENARTRRRKKIDGVEVSLPTVGKRRSGAMGDLTLPALSPQPSAYGKLQTLEPNSPPLGPLSSISPNMRSAKQFGRTNAFYHDDALLHRPNTGPTYYRTRHRTMNVSDAAASAAMTLAELRRDSPATKMQTRSIAGELENWGKNWRDRR